MSLEGEWRFALDRADAGLREAWFQRELPDRLRLPGVLQAQGFGDEISTNTPWVLSLYDRLWFLRDDYKAYTQPGRVKVPFVCQPPRHFVGVAWYERTVQIPPAWRGRQLRLFLERPHWESRVWIDGRLLGTNDSLVAPHEYGLGTVDPGPHRLSIRVDNRMLLPYRPDAHSVSDSLAGSWNGIVGAIEMRAMPSVWIEQVRAFPRVESRTVRLKISVGNSTGKPGRGTLAVGKLAVPLSWETNSAVTEVEVALPPTAGLWDEFHPELQELTVALKGEETDDLVKVVFGLREFRAEGQEFLVNGRRTHLRGTHHGGDFPLTGYPPAEVGYWRTLFETCRNWGLNHVRFHSFCPPEAAFAAADEVGIYLQVEPGMWNEISPGTAMERMLYVETERIINAYGNHPSFVMCSASNEPKGAWKRSLPAWVAHFREVDPRHLYTTGTGWSLIDEPGPVQGADYLAVHRIGLRQLRGQSAWFGRDYRASLDGVNVPVISHELGQWCAYPDYSVINKFSGYMRPGNLEIFRDSLKSHGLLGRNREFAYASGRFQAACYKEEIEANLRTPGLAGFQLLDLHDYMGQGTALVGLLDAFWEGKGYISPEEFQGFCSSTVPLARLKGRVFTTAEVLHAPVEIAHYGDRAWEAVGGTWRVETVRGREVAGGTWPIGRLALGRSGVLTNLEFNLGGLAAPESYRFVVGVSEKGKPGVTNGWKFWVYPAPAQTMEMGDVLVTSSWVQAQTKLADAGRVLFVPPGASLGWSSPPMDTVPVFWNRLMNPGWGRMLGLWCDTNHPALALFPTEANCDWQWTEIMRGTRAVNLDAAPAGLHPILAAIDDWNRNYKLGLIFECKVGAGRLLVCSIDIIRELERRPVARQLRVSLLRYVSSDKFQPMAALSPDQARALWFDTLSMRKLGAKVQASSGSGGLVMDGDPNTFWSAGGSGRGSDGRRYPHELTVSFPAKVLMRGLALLNRQNDRDHAGDIRRYSVSISDDGLKWREVANGELASTWNPQSIPFGDRVEAQHIKFTALSGFGADSSAALAEFSVLYDGPALSENLPASVEYKRVRSTSTDVDEGAPLPDAPQPQRKKR